MNAEPVREIVDLCLRIDETAYDAYRELSALSSKPELREFWHQMSGDEKSHIDFWQRVALYAEDHKLPQIFDDPQSVLSELVRTVPKVQTLLGRCREMKSVTDSFLLACRLEFYLLHPAFGTLFHVLRHLVGDPCPEDDYEAHVNSLIQMLAKHGEVTPELELLGETLGRLWRENRQLAARGTRDPLTGLLTRQAFMEIASHVAHLCARQCDVIGVMMADVDHFKKINDTHGHPVGDRVLRGVADLVRSSVRRADLVGRYGGEEFIVFMANTDADSAPLVAERLKEAVAAGKPESILTTVSVGLVTGTMEDPEDDLVHFISEADACLYNAKKRGRSRVVSKHLG